MNLRKWLTSVAVGAAMIGAASTAGAWTNIKNGTPNTIWVSYAWSSVSGFLCGYSTCGGSWAVQGWWQIAPGGTATVNGHTYGNALQQFYADDAFGHVWRGSGASGERAFQIYQTAYGPSCNDPNTNSMQWFRVIRNSRCCGGSCPDNYTLTIVL